MSNDKVSSPAYCTVLHAAKLRGITLNLDAKFIDFFCICAQECRCDGMGRVRKEPNFSETSLTSLRVAVLGNRPHL